MADLNDTVLISNAGRDASPNTYVIPAKLDFVPTSITARFDGSNATDPFLACLTFKSSNNLIMMRSQATRPVAGGTSAEVSFSPF